MTGPVGVLVPPPVVTPRTMARAESTATPAAPSAIQTRREDRSPTPRAGRAAATSAAHVAGRPAGSFERAAAKIPSISTRSSSLTRDAGGAAALSCDHSGGRGGRGGEGGGARRDP